MKSSDMSGSDYDSVGTGEIQDVSNHPDLNIPQPGLPSMEHSTKMAGDVLPFPSKDIAPNNTAVKNDIARRSGKSGGDNVVKPIFK